MFIHLYVVLSFWGNAAPPYLDAYPRNGSKLHVADQTPRGCLGLYDELGAENGDAAKSKVVGKRGSRRFRSPRSKTLQTLKPGRSRGLEAGVDGRQPEL